MSELEEKTAFKNKIESRTGTYHDKENDCKKGFQLPGSIISYLVLIKEGRKRKKEKRKGKRKEKKEKEKVIASRRKTWSSQFTRELPVQ